MSKSEVFNVFKKSIGGKILFDGKDNLITISDSDFPKFLDCDIDCIDVLKYSTQYERPDAYYLSSNGVLYLLEHFEVDITKKDANHGSPCKKEYSLFEKKVSNEFASEKDDVFINGSFDIKGTVQDFVDSVSYSLNNHYDKISEYKKRVLNELGDKDIKEIKVVFLMENPILLGTYFQKGTKIIEVFPFRYTNFLDLMIDKIDVDYFMYFSYCFSYSQVLQVFSREFLKTVNGETLDSNIILDCGHNEMAFRSIIK